MLTSNALKSLSLDAGFDAVGIAAATPAPDHELYETWIHRKFHGDMQYMEDPEGRRGDPRKYLPWAKSMLVVALNYYTGQELSTQPCDGAVSRYAWGRDYHREIRGRLETLRSAIGKIDSGIRTHPFVDTAPVLEKSFAEIAGLGWRGKHTNLLRKRFGSWFFLGGLVTDLELPPDSAAKDHCGTCRRCIDVCPTGAIVAPYVLDSRLCISYLTIELRGPIPRELRPLIGNRIYGCDDCQEVCPWNKFAKRTQVPGFFPNDGNLNPKLLPLMTMTKNEWNRRFKKTAMRRAHYEGFLRNVAVALGNWASKRTIPALVAALQHDSPLVRGHAAWALGRVQQRAASEIHQDDAAATQSATSAALQRRMQMEDDPWVREEIEWALSAGPRLPVAPDHNSKSGNTA